MVDAKKPLGPSLALASYDYPGSMVHPRRKNGRDGPPVLLVPGGFCAVWDPSWAHAKSQVLGRSRARAVTAPTWPVGAGRADGTCANHGLRGRNIGDCERTAEPFGNRLKVGMCTYYDPMH